jgi:hypothetical protein
MDRSSSPSRVKDFLFSTSSRLTLGSTQPRVQVVPVALSKGVKRPGREADHSLPVSATVKKMWIFTSTPQYGLNAIIQFKIRKNHRWPLDMRFGGSQNRSERRGEKRNCILGNQTYQTTR